MCSHLPAPSRWALPCSPARAIVIGEVALSLVLVSGAHPLLRSLLKLQGLDTGVRMENVITMSVDLPEGAYRIPQQTVPFYQAAAERLQAALGVAQAGISTALPLQWIGNGEAMKVAGLEKLVRVRFKRVVSRKLHRANRVQARSFATAAKFEPVPALQPVPIPDDICDALQCLAAAAGAAAVAALVAASVARHDGAALGTERGVGRDGRKRQLLLRVGLGGAKIAGGAAGHGVVRLLLRYEHPCTL